MSNTNISIKQWYLSTFPTDDLGCELNENATFSDLFSTLDNCKNVYDLLGVCDSIVRERVFEKLSEIIDVSYEYIYEQWLKGK